MLQAGFRLLPSETLPQVCTTLPHQGVRLSSPLSFFQQFFSTEASLHGCVSQVFPSWCLPHLFSAHSWKPYFCSFLAIFHFFLFLLLFNCEKHFLLQEKCPYALFELESCCSLFAVSRVVVFNVHPEMSIPFRVYGGRNPFDVIYETSCGWGPSPLLYLSLCSTSAITGG